MGTFNLADVLAGAGVNIDTGKREQIEYISIDRIAPDPDNFYELSGIEDLAENISLLGLQQPIRVRPMPGDDSKVNIISGHRRYTALKMLIEQDGRDDLRDVPCIVERGEENPKLTQLKLIYANASTRVMSSAEQAKQTELVEKLLYELKEDGMEFPGRMRDHVAQACQISTGKLARLKVIREKLIPQFMRLWEQNSLRESVAYTLARLSKERQRMIFIAQTNDYKNEFRCTDGWVENIARQMDDIKQTCKSLACSVCHTTSCDHMYTRLDHAAGLGQYEGMYCPGCCISCFKLADCKYSCEHAADAKNVLRDKRRADKRAEEEAKRVKDQPEKDLLALAYSRVGQLRKERNISAEDFVTASLGWRYAKDIDRLPKLEDGSSVSLNDRMPGSIWAREAKQLIETADLLGCSIDYMLGRDVPNSDAGRAQENVPNLGTGWRTGTPDEAGKYIVLARYHQEESYAPEKYEWTGKMWLDYGEPVEPLGILVDYWMPIPGRLPVAPNEEPARNGEPCMTGMSDSGLCGAAAYCNEPHDCCLQCDDSSCSIRCGWIDKEDDNAKMQ